MIIPHAIDRKLSVLVTTMPRKEWPVLLPYNKRTVLKAMIMYKKDNFYNYKLMAELYKAKQMHGTQFLMDLFILSELYISHWPQYKICELRRDIVACLAQNPNERILREEYGRNKGETFSHTHI